MRRIWLVALIVVRLSAQVPTPGVFVGPSPIGATGLNGAAVTGPWPNIGTNAGGQLIPSVTGVWNAQGVIAYPIGVNNETFEMTTLPAESNAQVLTNYASVYSHFIDTALEGVSYAESPDFEHLTWYNSGNTIVAGCVRVGVWEYPAGTYYMACSPTTPTPDVKINLLTSTNKLTWTPETTPWIQVGMGAWNTSLNNNSSTIVIGGIGYTLVEHGPSVGIGLFTSLASANFATATPVALIIPGSYQHPSRPYFSSGQWCTWVGAQVGATTAYNIQRWCAAGVSTSVPSSGWANSESGNDFTAQIADEGFGTPYAEALDPQILPSTDGSKVYLTYTANQGAPATVTSANIGPYNIMTGTSDQALIAIDGAAAVAITLPGGAAITAASVVSAINTALGAQTIVPAIANTAGGVSLQGAISVRVATPSSNSAYTVIGFTAATTTATPQLHEKVKLAIASMPMSNLVLSAGGRIQGGLDNLYQFPLTWDDTANQINAAGQSIENLVALGGTNFLVNATGLSLGTKTVAANTLTLNFANPTITLQDVHPSGGGTAKINMNTCVNGTCYANFISSSSFGAFTMNTQLQNAAAGYHFQNGGVDRLTIAGDTGNITLAALGTGVGHFNSSGFLTSSGVVAADISGALTQNTSGNASTATALAANGTNCSAGSYPLGVDASGNSESCTVAASPTLSATSASIGGGVLIAGSCATGTVTISGATTNMVASVSPAGGVDPTNGSALGVTWEGRISAANTVVVSVCTPIAGTPTAAAYNVRVIQ